MPGTNPTPVTKELLIRARQTTWFPSNYTDDQVVILADLHLTRGKPRTDVLGLVPGYSVALEDFQRLHCIPRHGDEPHDVLACVQTAYYERLERDRAKLAARAEGRGMYGPGGSSKT